MCINSSKCCVSIQWWCRVPVEAGSGVSWPGPHDQLGGQTEKGAGLWGLRICKEGPGKRWEVFCSAQSKTAVSLRRPYWFTSTRSDFTKLSTFFFLTQWYAVCLSDAGEYEGVKVKIGNSYIIREHLEVRGHLSQCYIIIVSHLSIFWGETCCFFLESHPAQSQGCHFHTYFGLLVSRLFLLFTITNRWCNFFFFSPSTAASGTSESSVYIKSDMDTNLDQPSPFYSSPTNLRR